MAIAIVFVGATPAFAADGITFTPPATSVEYGQNWQILGVISPQTYPDDAYGSLAVTTAGTTKNLGTDRVYRGGFEFEDNDFDLSLGAGTHSFSAAFTGGVGTASSSTPVVLTITPAPLLATTTIAPDPNNSNNAIITSQLGGDFVNQLPNCACEGQGGYLLPAGTWKLTVTDAQGQSVFAKQVNQAANGLPTYVSYWQNVPAGETFTAQSTFTVGGSDASNFTLTSQKFSWTSAKSNDNGGTIPSTNTPKPKTAKTPSFAPPLLVFYAALLIAVILLALDILLLLPRRRSRRTPTETAEVRGS